MAEPFDAATNLQDVINVVQTQYFENFEEQTTRFGGPLNRLFQFADEPITGNGQTLQVEVAPGDTVRADTDALADMPNPNSFQAGTLQVRWNQQTAASNDFTRLAASAQIDHYTIQNASRGTIVDVADRIYRQLVPEWREKLAIHRMLDRTAMVARVNEATPARNDSWNFTDATATASNTNGLRVRIDNGSISYLRPGSIVDFYDDTNSDYPAQNIEVTDVNTDDLSVGFKYNSSGITARQSSGDLANVANNDQIFYSGERNKGMYSIGANMADPDTDTAWIGGITRTDAANRWTIPIHTRLDSTSTRVDKSFISAAAQKMGYRSEGERPVLILTQIDIHDTLRDDFGEDSFINIPVSDSRMERFANLGSIGLNYQHPIFGLVKVMADPLYTPNVVDIIDPSCWRTLFYQDKTLRFLPGDTGGYWYRMESATPGNGRTLIYKTDAISNLLDFCFAPWKNCRIHNVTAT